MLRFNTFDENGAFGGESGGGGATDGIGKGGAIFALNDLNANTNGNNRGMPESLPNIIGCANEFEDNFVQPAPPGTDTDNVDTFGTSRVALIGPCPPPDSVPAVGGPGMWLLGALLTLAGWLGLKRRN